jgi:RNA polymerase sigma-70 factor (ECF subfamily)
MSTPAADMGALVIEHLPALRRYARTLKRTADQADDLVQDTIERALARAELFQPGTNLRAWLLTMMRNIFITGVRKAALRRTYAAELMALERRVSPASQADIVLLKDSLAVMARLSPGERQAVKLLGIEELTYEAAAHVAEVPVGTMKSRLSRGRDSLRALVDGGSRGAA